MTHKRSLLVLLQVECVWCLKPIRPCFERCLWSHWSLLGYSDSWFAFANLLYPIGWVSFLFHILLLNNFSFLIWLQVHYCPSLASLFLLVTHFLSHAWVPLPESLIPAFILSSQLPSCLDLNISELLEQVWKITCQLIFSHQVSRMKRICRLLCSQQLKRL